MQKSLRFLTLFDRVIIASGYDHTVEKCADIRTEFRRFGDFITDFVSDFRKMDEICVHTAEFVQLAEFRYGILTDFGHFLTV